MTKFILLCIVATNCMSCVKSLDPNDSITPLLDKLNSTFWKIKKSRNDSYIKFLDNKIKIGVGRVLGSIDTAYNILENTYNYAVIEIYDSYNPTIMAIELLNTKEIRVVAFNTTKYNFLKDDMRFLLKSRGNVFIQKMFLQ